jgi:fatty-acyl-CoA synthase
MILGDRVGIWSPNNSEWVLAQLATAKIGAVLVNINPAYKSDELEYVLNLVECNTLIMAPSLKTSSYIDIINDVIPELKKSVPGIHFTSFIIYYCFYS